MDSIWLKVGSLSCDNSEYDNARLVVHCMRGAERLGVSWEEITSASRKRKIVEARRLCCMFLYEKGWTLKEVAKSVGCRNHTSVLHHKNLGLVFLELESTFRDKHLIFHNG